MNAIIQKKTSLFLIAALLFLGLSGCGGGSGGVISPKVGQFIDDPVSGMGYSCAGSSSTQNQSGLTDAQGQFTYYSDQTCTFNVGKVTLGLQAPIPADGKVTPQDVAGVHRGATAAPSAVAIAQFLQSLNDGSSGGTIVIPVASQNLLNNAPPVTLVTSAGAISQSDLQSLLANVPSATLVSASMASAALDAQITNGVVSVSTGEVSAGAPPVLNSISVSSTVPSNPAGLTQQHMATGYYSNGSQRDITSEVTWSSSDTSLMTVNSLGQSTGIKKGSAKVIASLTPVGTKTAVTGSVVQTTTEPILTSISISHSNSLPVGLSDQLFATGTYSDGSSTDLTNQVTWATTDTTKLTVDANGLVTGLLMGTATVTATYLPSGLTNALVASFIENVLAPSPLNLVIFYIQYGLTTIQNMATALMQAVVSFTDKSIQTVSSVATWTVNAVSGGGSATVTSGASSASNATLTATSPGVISVIASYLGLNSNPLGLTISPLAPAAQNATISLNVMGVNDSTATGRITATDPEGYVLSYRVQTDGNVGKATVNADSGVFSYTVSGMAMASSDSFTIQVSNGKTTSLATVAVALNTDPLLQNQWHLRNFGTSAFASVLPSAGNDMNVAGAWALGYTGKGVNVAVVDTGLEIAHEDLAANVDVTHSRNLRTDTTNPSPNIAGADHGTQVAGIIGSVAFNGKGGRGVAYGANLRGYNLLGSGVSPSILNFGNALGLATYSADNDIFNESFAQSPTNLDPVTNSYAAINNNLLAMRGGKGAILIQSAGNEFQSFNDGTTICSRANSYNVSCGDTATDTRRDGTLPIIVGAINADGIKSSYSTTGTSIWVSAPGGEYGIHADFLPVNGSWYNSLLTWLKSFVYKPAIVTTALTGCQNAANGTTKVNLLDAQGQNAYAQRCQYTALMNGTSSAAPNLSGVVALMLEANPNLGYRDVKYILAKTAKKVDTSNIGITTTNIINGSSAPVTLDQGWVMNAAGNWFSTAYGFGSVDAVAAVNMAKSFSSYLPAQQSASSAMHFVNDVTVPNASTTGSTMTFSMSPIFSKIEQVILYVNISASPALTCNQIELTSPSGTKSILMHAANGFSNNGNFQSSIPGTRFLSNAFYGETSAGNWTLRILDFCNTQTRTAILSTDTQTLTLTGH